MPHHRPWAVERHAGRIVEISVRELDSTWEVGRFSKAIYDLAVKTPDAVLVVDLRTPLVFSDEVASAVVDLMVRANAVRQKTAILLSNEHAIFGLQLTRLVRQAADARRRTFTDPKALLNWLGQDLFASERVRVAAFLDPRPRVQPMRAIAS